MCSNLSPLTKVNNFSLACTNETLVNKICDIIGKKLQLPNENKPPFSNMDLINNFNRINITQTDAHIEISCVTHVDQLAASHGQKEDEQIKELSKTTVPFNAKNLN